MKPEDDAFRISRHTWRLRLTGLHMRTAFDRTHVKLSAPIERSDSHRALTCRAFSFENRDDIQHYNINSLRGHDVAIKVATR